MEVYLVQHGEAKPESEDPERPLTARGRSEAESVARNAAASGIQVTRILHSGKTRARQTAEILADHLAPAEGVSEHKGLSPLDDPREVKLLVEQVERPVMLVGHLPHLSKLAATLITGDTEKEVVRFRMAGIVCLGLSDAGWAVNWILTPEIAGV